MVSHPTLKETIIDFLSVGTVVSFKSHPYFDQNDTDYILLSGEAQLIPPILVVVEILKENNSEQVVYQKRTGNIETKCQCRCLWFSSKTQQFEQVWLDSSLLKVVRSRSQRTSKISETKKMGALVCFKTAFVEISKKKSSIKNSNYEDKTLHKIITPHLTFVSPIMQVIGELQAESLKESNKQKKGKLIRTTSIEKIKCKYYNHHLNKFSEVILPIESVELITEANEKTLEFLKHTINKGKYLKVKQFYDVSHYSILKPEVITYRNGLYYLEAYDYLQNKEIEVLITDDPDQFSATEKCLSELPIFIEKDTELIIKPINSRTIQEVIGRKLTENFVRIKYKDANETRTTRTLYNCSLINSKEIVDGEIYEIQYLKGFCLLRNAIRYFKVNRIEKIQVLSLFKPQE